MCKDRENQILSDKDIGIGTKRATWRCCITMNSYKPANQKIADLNNCEPVKLALLV